MRIIHDHLHQWDETLPQIALRAPRTTLARRRWRGVAQDGVEFGFDLEHPLVDGDVFFQDATKIYLAQQEPEKVLEVSLNGLSIHPAQLGWHIGNLHFPLAFENGVLIAIDDSAVRHLFQREGVAFIPVERVFRPLAAGHSHAPDS